MLSKSAKKIVSRTSGEGRSTSLLLKGGRMRVTSAAHGSASGIRFRVTSTATYPSPTKLLHHHSGSGRLVMTMTLPKWMADVGLRKGRTLTMTGTYRLAGLGSRSITLADTAATDVTALGIRTRLRSLRMINAKPAFARQLKKEMRPIFAAKGGTAWVAKHRGTVQAKWTADDGSAMTQKQVSCG